MHINAESTLLPLGDSPRLSRNPQLVFFQGFCGMEMLDIVDKSGCPTGAVVERAIAHRDGILHRTSHVWIVRRTRGSGLQILLQKRSNEKDSFPGCFDISSAGHIPAGSGWKDSAIRELKEELGLEVAEEELLPIGKRYVSVDAVFHGRSYRDRQVSAVFTIFLNNDSIDFALQAEEVSAVVWMDLDECMKGVRENSFPNCIDIEELQMLRSALVRVDQSAGSSILTDDAKKFCQS